MIKNKISVVTALLVLSSSAFAANVWVNNGKIANSPHNLSATATGVLANGEICVFCHTPHAANSAFDGAPLWNKAASSASTYKLYGAASAGVAGQTIAGTAVGDVNGTLSSPSLACLSCHDGVSAINSIVNAPGSGMGDLTTGGAGGAITMTTFSATSTFGGNIGGGTSEVDMSNDHPVSVPYMGTAGGTDDAVAGSPASLRPATAVLTDWVGANGTSAGLGTINDILRNGNVECSSCHDPHNGYASLQDGPEVNFLRRTNAGSQLCLGCHDK